MNPASLIPATEPIPVPPVWFEVLLVIGFAAHILFMNAAVGGAAVSLFSLGNARVKDHLYDTARKLPGVLALTINLGVVPLLFLQVVYGQFDYTSSVLMGWWWLAVVGALMTAYYGLYVYDFRFDRGALPKLSLAVSLALALYVAFMFSNNMTLMLVPEQWTQYFTAPSGEFLNLHDPTLWPRFAHFMAATLAVGGLFHALLANRRGDDAGRDLGLKWFMRMTYVNFAAGAWFLIMLPREIVLQFMGGNPWATAALFLGIASAGGSLWFASRKLVMPAAGHIVLAVLLMATARHFLRAAYLAPWFHPSELPVTNQYGPLALFIVSAVVGAFAVVWMINLARRAGKES